MIQVRYFASLRETLGVADEQFDATPPDVATLIEALAQRGEPWSDALNGRVLCAVNQEMAQRAAPLQDGDEVGLFPPVTGG